MSSHNPPGVPPADRPVTVPDFLAAKKAGRKLVLLTAYDATSARLLDQSGVDALLVGDSLGMVVQGQADSLAVTLAEMTYHCKLVSRGTKRALVIADLPFMSYQVSPRQALRSAGQLLKRGQAHAVKLEGGERSVEAVRAIVNAEIPVMGHIGLTPQSVRRLGGFRVQRDEQQLFADAWSLVHAGVFALVIECVPAALAEKLTKELTVPTIGIGAGPGCDGQILVTHDLLGLFDGFRPKFVKTYADLGKATTEAVSKYADEVRSGKFPGPEHEFK